MYELFLESIKPVSNIILNDDLKNEIIIHENISCCYLKKISSLFVVVNKGKHSRSTYPILRTTYPNNFLFIYGLKRVDVGDKWNFRAGCI